jgi:hypothetical protein
MIKKKSGEMVLKGGKMRLKVFLRWVWIAVLFVGIYYAMVCAISLPTAIFVVLAGIFIGMIIGGG